MIQLLKFAFVNLYMKKRKDKHISVILSGVIYKFDMLNVCHVFSLKKKP